MATDAVRFFATGAARFIFLTPAFRADAVFVTVVFRVDATFFRADAFFLLADFRTDAVFFPAVALFCPADRVRLTLRRVVAAFRRAVLRAAAFRLAMSSLPFCAPYSGPGLP
ncbi:MAG TPA: hypothetical protein VIR54_03630 [Vicinamibacterales bacterium]